MLEVFRKNKLFIFLVIIITVVLAITFRHNIGLIIDCGREVYYPQQILNGEVLYKDLFNIYGPFAYLFNAVLYKIFGINTDTLYFAGSICATVIVLTTFFIVKKLFNENVAFSIALFSVAVGMTPVYIFNYIFPYSFAMTYGLAGFLLSLFFLINYICSKQNLFLYISLFFAGLSVCSKYEFLPYLLIYFIIFWKFKPKFNTYILGLLSFGIIPEICFATLFAQGLQLADLKHTINIITAMSQTQTLKYFYMHSGVLPHKQTIFALFLTFTALVIPFFIYMLPVIFKEKFNKIPILNLILTYGSLVLIIALNLFKMNDIFMATPIALAVLIILNYKKLIKNFVLFIVVTSVLLCSLKVFWGLVLNSYGIYYLPLILTAIGFIFKDKFTEFDWNHISFYFLIFAILIAFNNIKSVSKNTVYLSTNKGRIFVEKKYEKTKDLLLFIEKNTKKSDKILILPEGMMINFLSDRKTDGFYNTMLPLYEETFGIETFKKHFSKSMPKYIIFNSWNSNDYYFSIICKDYGFDFCKFVKNNYFQKLKLSGDSSYVIFEKK